MAQVITHYPNPLKRTYEDAFASAVSLQESKRFKLDSITLEDDLEEPIICAMQLEDTYLSLASYRPSFGLGDESCDIDLNEDPSAIEQEEEDKCVAALLAFKNTYTSVAPCPYAPEEESSYEDWDDDKPTFAFCYGCFNDDGTRHNYSEGSNCERLQDADFVLSHESEDDDYSL
jgi:hypothetical protein